MNYFGYKNIIYYLCNKSVLCLFTFFISRFFYNIYFSFSADWWCFQEKVMKGCIRKHLIYKFSTNFHETQQINRSAMNRDWIIWNCIFSRFCSKMHILAKSCIFWPFMSVKMLIFRFFDTSHSNIDLPTLNSPERFFFVGR